MANFECKEVFIVNYYESERGWGNDTWDREFDTQEEAMAAVEDCNKDNPLDHVPDHYIVAKYVGSKLVKI